MDEVLHIADESLLRLVWPKGKLPVAATKEEADAAFQRVLARAREYDSLRRIIESGEAPELVRLVRRASPFVEAVAVMAEDKSKALEWMCDAATAVGTPDPLYACGASHCDDPACSTHNSEHPFRDE